MNLESLGSLATVGALLVSIIGLALELRRSRGARNVDLIIDFDKRFESEEMRRKRKLTGEFLSQPQRPSTKDPKWSEVDDVIDFFETLGTCVRTGHINVELAYRFFYYWLGRYWLACETYINEARETVPQQWDDAEWLYKKLRAYDVKRNAGKFTNPTDQDLRTFFEDEAEGA